MRTAFFQLNSHAKRVLSMTAIFAIVSLASCKKWDNPNPKPAAYSAEVLDKWMTMQLRLMRNATGIPNHAFSRHFAYTGVAALESMGPCLPAHEKWTHKWNGLSGLPTAHSAAYYYPANVNAAMASMNRSFFPNASEADKNAIDSLEDALNTQFLSRRPKPVIAASSNFGKAVALAVFNWAETDGYKDAGKPYTPPVGAGLWVPTAPAFASAVTPYWGNNRTVITGSTLNTDIGAPLAFSTDIKSPFYQMAKQVYDASQSLTDEQKAMAIFWRDIPGATSPGHWLSIVQQVIRQNKTPLDKAALAYALTGAAGNDGLICCLKSKYQYNLLRPITYIRDVMGHPEWTPHLGTPAHPEYSSSHSALSAAAAGVLERLFKNFGRFTDHTYDYLGFAPRTYPSFKAIGDEAGASRLYGGIHYQPSIDLGLEQGRKVVSNIFKNTMAY